MRIKSLRLSFVFTETILDVQRETKPGVPLGAFVTEPGYVQIVDALQKGGGGPLEIGLPWPYPVGQHFWDEYLHDKRPGDARGKLCFEKLVPLRMRKLADAVRTDLSEVPRVTVEGFYYPYGTGLLLTAAAEGDFGIPETGGLAQRLRYDKIYSVRWAGGGTTAALTLEQLATAALDTLRELGFGSGPSGPRSRLFSIATVVRGEDVDPQQPLVPGSQEHRLLNGLAGWVRAWEQLQPPALAAGKTQLDVRSAAAWPGNVLFAARRGRAVWFPGLFVPVSPPVHSLSCYHRNLCFGSLQTESLLMLAAAAEEAFANPASVPNSIQRLGRLAAGLVARLHGGAKTYRSDSFRAQIAQSDQLQDVNALRNRFGMKPQLE